MDLRGVDIIKKATQEQIFDRRKDMLHYSMLGLKAKEWIPMVASNHKVSEDAIRKDWTKRQNWIRILLKIDDPEALALSIIMNNEVALSQAYKLFEQAQDIKTKIQTLWLIIKTNQIRVNCFKELGVPCQVKFADENKSDNQQELLEEEFPYRIGDKDRHIRTMALLKR